MEENREKERCYIVVKANDLIQKSRYSLTLQEQKTIAYICSLIEPNSNNKEYWFDVNEYCKICGLSICGKNYEDIKNVLKSLNTKGFELETDEMWTSVKWIEKPKFYKSKGQVYIRLDEDLLPYLLDLKERFTQYELYNILAMKSGFSFRIYELLKSYQKLGKKKFTIDNLKEKLMVQNVKSYARFPDFRRKVIEVAVEEINELTDINVSWETETKGRKVIAIVFYITLKNSRDNFKAKCKTQIKIDKLDKKNSMI